MDAVIDSLVSSSEPDWKPNVADKQLHSGLGSSGSGLAQFDVACDRSAAEVAVVIIDMLVRASDSQILPPESPSPLLQCQGAPWIRSTRRGGLCGARACAASVRAQ